MYRCGGGMHGMVTQRASTLHRGRAPPLAPVTAAAAPVAAAAAPVSAAAVPVAAATAPVTAAAVPVMVAAAPVTAAPVTTAVPITAAPVTAAPVTAVPVTAATATLPCLVAFAPLHFLPSVGFDPDIPRRRFPCCPLPRSQRGPPPGPSPRRRAHKASRKPNHPHQ